MKTPVTFLAIFALSLSALAQEERLGLGTGLEFKASYQQCLTEIKQTADRIQLIPAKSEDNMGIPYAVLCAEVVIPPAKFEKLSSIGFTTGSKVPSAGESSGYGGSTTIGSNTVRITADFPDYHKKGNHYSVSASAGVTTVDPNRKSTSHLSIDIAQNGKEETTEETGLRTEAQKYQYVSLFMYTKTQEGFEFMRAIDPTVEVSLSSSLATQEIAGDLYEHEAVTSELNATGTLRMSKVANSEPSDKPAKISICWSPNNYESITMEPAELIKPELVLRYGDEDKK